MKILFLDCDGVLNDRACLMRGIHLDPERVLMVNQLCMDTGCDVVISSSWRIIYDLKTMQALLYRAGLSRGRVISVTPKTREGHRGTEIRHWLSDNSDVKKFAIIDDDSDMLVEQRPFFVQTSFEDGMNWSHATELRAILGDK